MRYRLTPPPTTLRPQWHGLRHGRWAAVGVLALCSAPALLAQSQEVRPGLWRLEVQKSQLQHGKQVLDVDKIIAQLDDQLRSMDPEVRTLMEENLRNAGVELHNAQYLSVCVPASRAQVSYLAERYVPGSCSVQPDASSHGAATGALQCQHPQREGRYSFEVTHPERVQHGLELRTQSGTVYTLQASLQWQAADCKGVVRWYDLNPSPSHQISVMYR